MHRIVSTASLLLVIAVSSLHAAPPPDEHARLWALFDAHWQWTLAENPALATEIGDVRYDDRLDDLSPEAIARRQKAERDFQQQARAIVRARLSPADQLHYDLFVDQINTS